MKSVRMLYQTVALMTASICLLVVTNTQSYTMADTIIPSDFRIVANYTSGSIHWRSWKTIITSQGEVQQIVRPPYNDSMGKDTTKKFTLSEIDLLDFIMKMGEVHFIVNLKCPVIKHLLIILENIRPF